MTTHGTKYKIYPCYLSPVHDASEVPFKSSSHEVPPKRSIQELYWIRVGNYHGWAEVELVKKVQIIVKRKRKREVVPSIGTMQHKRKENEIKS